VLRGTFTVIDANAYGDRRHCGFAYGHGLDDLGPGTQVTVTNQAGTIIGIGELDDGYLRESVVCVFRFKVSNLPRSDFYSVEVSHRGEVRFSFSKLTQKHWSIKLALD
jgi:hypothetical protein